MIARVANRELLLDYSTRCLDVRCLECGLLFEHREQRLRRSEQGAGPREVLYGT
jgi:hypothetical protein